MTDAFNDTLEKVEVAGLDESSLEALKCLLLDHGCIKELRIRDACYILHDTASWLNSMIGEGCLNNVEAFNLISTEKFDIPGLTTDV